MTPGMPPTRPRFPVRFLPSVGLWEVDVRPYGRIRSLLMPGMETPMKLVAKQMADEVRATILRDIERGVPEQIAVSPYLPRESLVEAWAAKWLKHLESLVRHEKRSPNYVRRLHDFAGPEGSWSPLYGSSIHSIGYARIEDYVTELRDAGVHPTTIAHTLGALQTCLRWAAKRLGGTYVVPEFPELERAEHEPIILTPEQQDRILEQIVEPKRGVFLALVDLMIRPSEARAIDVGHYDFSSHELRVEVAMKGARKDAPIGPTKGRDRRLVLVTERLAGWLETHVPLRARVERTVPLFSGRSGRWAHSSLDDVWKAAIKKTDVPACGLYEGTKHSTSTWLRSRGFTLEEIGLAMGHAHARRGEAVTEGYAQRPRVANASIAQMLDERLRH